nr:hypothetical protein [Nanoarchaeum sp.]
MKLKIGILGGIGPESSALFYEQLIKIVQSKKIKSNTEYPYIILESIPAPELILENPDLTMYSEALKNLQKNRVDFIVIVCNTAYVYINQFKSMLDTPIIDLNEETEKILKKNKVKKITIFGSKKTIDKLFHFKDIEINKITDEESRSIDKLILEYNLGKNKEELFKKFIKIINKYPKQEVLIACTELSTMLKNKNQNYLDTFDILLNATFNRWNRKILTK